MRELIIHFGMHKTGSSSIQKTLFEFQSENEFVYLNPGYPNSSGPVASAFLENPEEFHGNRKRGLDKAKVFIRRDSFLKRINNDLDGDATKFIISAEDFCRLSTSGFGRFIDIVSPKVDSIRAVGYVRSPKEFMESYFQQMIKDDETSSLDFHALYPNYRQRFEKFEIVLGKQNVEYWFFSPDSLHNGCVVEDFCHRLNINIPKDRVFRINDGLSRSALAILYVYRKYGAGYGVGHEAVKENRRLIRTLSKLRGPKLRFSPSVVSSVIDVNNEDMDWMESRLPGGAFRRMSSASGADVGSESELEKICLDTLCECWALLGVQDCGYSLLQQEVVKWAEYARKGISQRLAAEKQGVPQGAIGDIVRALKGMYPEELGRMNERKGEFLLRKGIAEFLGVWGEKFVDREEIIKSLS